MKTRAAKKCGVYAALAAVLLITAALLTSCPPPLDELTWDGPSRQAGYLYLKVDDGSARTILPASPTFGYFEVDITRTAGTDPSITAHAITGTSLTLSVPIASLGTAGTFNVTVRAYVSSTSGVAATAATTTPVSIDPTNPSGVTIATPLSLTAVGVASGNGMFAWNLTMPSNLATADTALMTVTGSGGAVITDQNVKTANTTGVSIPAGYYNVKVTLTKARYRTEFINEVVHIYAGMTSTYTDSFPALSRNRYDVNYVNITGADDDPEGTDTDLDDNGGLGWLHDNLIDAPSPPTYKDATMVFDKWYTSSARTTAWNFTSDKIIGDMDLYAGWVAPISLGLTVNYTHLADEELVITPAVTSITRTALGIAANTVQFSIGAEGVDYTTGSAVITTSSGTGEKDISSANDGTGIVTLVFTDTGNMGSPISTPSEPGTYIISVKVTVSGVDYSGTFKITITSS